LIRYFEVNGPHWGDELYDLASDAEELDNLATSRSDIFLELGAELDDKLRQVDQPYS
jgi:hypothetical protein